MKAFRSYAVDHKTHDSDACASVHTRHTQIGDTTMPNARIATALGALLAVAMTAACGSGGSTGNPTAPSTSIPIVSGAYTGTVTAQVESQSLSCSASTTVNQGSGGSISFSPIQLGSPCSTSVALQTTSIDSTGAVNYIPTALTLQGCVFIGSINGGFFGRTLQMNFVLRPQTVGCPVISYAFRLTR